MVHPSPRIVTWTANLATLMNRSSVVGASLVPKPKAKPKLKSRPVNVALIPPAPILSLALVGMRDDRMDEVRRRLGGITTDKLRKLAKLALTLSQKDCFFCGTKADVSLRKALAAKSVPWHEIVLCSCLASLREGYREYYPWQKEFAGCSVGADVADILASRNLDPRTLMYTNACSRSTCGGQFRVTAQMIAASYSKYGQHRQMRRCKKCITEARQLAQIQKTDGSESNGVVPARKRKQLTRQNALTVEGGRVPQTANNPKNSRTKQIPAR